MSGKSSVGCSSHEVIVEVGSCVGELDLCRIGLSGCSRRDKAVALGYVRPWNRSERSDCQSVCVDDVDVGRAGGAAGSLRDGVLENVCGRHAASASASVTLQKSIKNRKK